MKKIFFYCVLVAAFFTSCLKEYSAEQNPDGSDGIIGADCRISKISYSDSAGITAIGSIGATINAADAVTDITKFDSLTLTIEFNAAPQNFGDTVAIDPDQYFITEGTAKRIKQFHGLIDPAVQGSPEFDVAYVYDAAGFLINKFYTLSSFPGFPYQKVSYTYNNGNLIKMVTDDLFTGDVIKDASLTYTNTVAPKNFWYLFPDEITYAEFNQFYNFGKKSANGVQSLKLRFYDPGNLLVDSAVSTFSNYIMSRDNYAVSVNMNGSDQSFIPATAGKLRFTYKCR